METITPNANVETCNSLPQLLETPIECATTTEPSSSCENDLEQGGWQVFTNPDLEELPLADTSDDLLDRLTEAFLEAARPNWSRSDYSHILFCQIGDIHSLETHFDNFGKNMVFTMDSLVFGREENCYKIPVIYVTFCGRVLRASNIGEERWYEIEDDTGKILCCASERYVKDSYEVKNKYYKAHKTYRHNKRMFEQIGANLEQSQQNMIESKPIRMEQFHENFKIEDPSDQNTNQLEPSEDPFEESSDSSEESSEETSEEPSLPDTKENVEKQMEQSHLLWLLERQSKQLYDKRNEVRLTKYWPEDKAKVKVVGKVWQKGRQRYIYVRKCVFIDEKEEKHILKMVNMWKQNK